MSNSLTEPCESDSVTDQLALALAEIARIKHFNGLSPREAELFACLAEECGEVMQRIGKILRHGIRVNPYKESDAEAGTLNTRYLEDELADLHTIEGMLGHLGVIDQNRIVSLIFPKLERLRRPDILHHSFMPTMACARCGSTVRIQVDGPEGSSVCRDTAACASEMAATEK